MKLHENKELYRQAIRYTAQEMKIKEIYVEKDYWVCFVLNLIYKLDFRNEILFKGGTSLSKCYGLLQRFSEDIDLVVLKRQGETESELIHKRDSISLLINEHLPEVHVEGFTKIVGSNRRSAHSYNKEFKGSFGQVKDLIYIDASHMETYEPFRAGSIRPYVAEMMEKSQTHMIERYELFPVELSVLDPSRTICDKIMNFVRMSYTADPIANYKSRIRHAYDLHLLLLQEDYSEFFESSGFDRMMKEVIHHDRVSYENVNGYLDKHPMNAAIFRDVDTVWKNLSSTYTSEFGDLVYGKLPPEEEIVNTFRRIFRRLSRLNWPPE